MSYKNGKKLKWQYEDDTYMGYLSTNYNGTGKDEYYTELCFFDKNPDVPGGNDQYAYIYFANYDLMRCELGYRYHLFDNDQGGGLFYGQWNLSTLKSDLALSDQISTLGQAVDVDDSKITIYIILDKYLDF